MLHHVVMSVVSLSQCVIVDHSVLAVSTPVCISYPPPPAFGRHVLVMLSQHMWHCRLIMLSRLFYRKGVDLAVAILPTLCRKYPQLRVIIGGDGPMGVDLEHMIATYSLENCVSLVGPVRHEDVCQHLVQGVPTVLPVLCPMFSVLFFLYLCSVQDPCFWLGKSCDCWKSSAHVKCLISLISNDVPCFMQAKLFHGHPS